MIIKDSQDINLVEVEKIKIFNLFIILFCFINYFIFNVYLPKFMGDMDFLWLKFFSASNLNYHLVFPVITANFLHGNLIHIVLNIFIFKSLENSICCSLNFRHYLQLFKFSLIGSIIGIFLQIYLATGDIFIVGLSGIIFGIFGFLFFTLPLKLKIINFILIFAYHIAIFIYFEDVKIAWAVHLGGFLGGAYYYYKIK